MSENVAERLILAFIGAVVAAAGFTVGYIVFNDDAMPCGQHEVQVWDRYPETTKCVADDDHASHQGAHG